MIIYQYRNKENGKVYIGLTTQGLKRRHRQHILKMRDGTYFHNALMKYGESAFDLTIIDTAETRDELIEKEKYWIKARKSFAYIENSNGYNETTGGEGGSGLSGELNSQYGISPQERMDENTYAQWLINIKKSSKKGEKNPCYKKHPREWDGIGEEKWDMLLKSLSDRWKGSNNPNIKNPKKGKDHPLFGKQMSQDAKEKMRNLRKNRKITNEDVKKIQELYAQGKHLQREIADIYGISRQTVGDIINGRIYNHLRNEHMDYSVAKINNEKRRTKSKEG